MENFTMTFGENNFFHYRRDLDLRTSNRYKLFPLDCRRLRPPPTSLLSTFLSRFSFLFPFDCFAYYGTHGDSDYTKAGMRALVYITS